MVYQIVKQIKYFKNDLVMSNTTRNYQKKTTNYMTTKTRLWLLVRRTSTNC